MASIQLKHQMGNGERPLLVTHGFGLGDQVSSGDSVNPSGAPSDAQVTLSAEDLRQIAEDLITALCSAHADLVAEARADHRWDAHLGTLVREAWSDYQAVAGTQVSDAHFRAALNRILADGRPVF